jgi:phosphate transport system protein
MRDAFHEELDAIGDELVEMTRLVGSAMSRASTALIDADLALAESVIASDEAVDKAKDDLDQRTFDLLARQQPVATDLRLLVTTLRISADLERMGDLARHIAKVARMRYPQSAVPPEFTATIIQMSQTATRIVAKCGSVIAAKDVALALELERDDDVMDDLHRRLYTQLLDQQYRVPIECAMDLTLCGRYYERFADHAVSVARRVVYLVTGERADEFVALHGGP